VLGKSWVFAYDTAGNILSKKEYAYTTGTLGALLDTKTYTYAATGWKDKLVSFNGEGIAYDALGNPTTYRGHALTWGKIRQLESYDNHMFAYDAGGNRICKNSITYTYDGANIIQENRPTGAITYYYGISGVCGFKYNGVVYFYEKGLQGDITAVYDENGNKKAEYQYDAWGNQSIITDIDGIGTLNPFRYRGYYYDVETNLYYLQSRYYDPQTGRFINADDMLDSRTFSGYNLYAYCLNNPIAFVDKYGNFALTILGITITAKAVATFCAFAALYLTATVIVLSPGFQDAWNNMCSEIAGTVSEGLAVIGDGIGKSIDWIKAKAKDIAQSIGDSFARVKEKPAYKSEYELHHLVAKKAKNARYARSVLESVGIGVNDPENLLLIKTGLHRRLHTDTYYGWANSVVISAYESAGGDKELQRKYVLAALETIRAFVLMLNTQAPY